MKKIVLFAISIVCVVAIGLGVLYSVDMNRMKNNEPVFFSTWGIDYAPPIEKDTTSVESGDEFEAQISSMIKQNINPENKLFKDSKTTIETMAMLSYETSLLNFIDIYRLPDMTYEEIVDPKYDATKNEYAIFDVDNDGSKELLLALTNNSMASKRTIIYDYDSETNTIKEQFVEFPDMIFYDNGVLKVKNSHNQGVAGDVLWPYTLYRYNSNLDDYDIIASIDAWDKQIMPVYYGEEFPTDVDKDGDGIIYYIIPNGNQEEKYAVDFEAYNDWQQTYINENINELNIEYKNLTKENIYAAFRLDYPSGDLSTKGTNEIFKYNGLELYVTNVKEKVKYMVSDGTDEWEEEKYIVYPGSKVYVTDTSMSVSEEGKLAPDWKFYYLDKDNPNDSYDKRIVLGMEAIEVTEDLVGVVSENVAVIIFEVYK